MSQMTYSATCDNSASATQTQTHRGIVGRQRQGLNQNNASSTQLNSTQRQHQHWQLFKSALYTPRNRNTYLDNALQNKISQRFGVMLLKEFVQTNHLHLQSNVSHQWSTQKLVLKW